MGHIRLAIFERYAFTKKLNEICDRVRLVGISQGGEAVLISSLFEQPDQAYIISGFYKYFDLSWKGYDQILIPKLNLFF